jgi:biotin transport system substrate-specific component
MSFFRSPAFASLPVSLSINLVLSLLGTLLIALSAKIQIPFWPVPMTLQTLSVMLIAALGGLRLAGLTFTLYLIEGAVGFPVFAGTPERGIGLIYMMGPTGGYLLGYLLATFIVGFAADRGLRTRPFALFAVMLAAMLPVYALGVLWLSKFTGLPTAISAGALPFIAGDFIKVALTSALVLLSMRSSRGSM